MARPSNSVFSPAGPGIDPAALARRALAEQTEEAALPHVRASAERAVTDARLWQWTGLLLRALDRRDEALEALRRAASLAPADPSIAQGLAHVSLEAGLDAVDLFLNARRLAPTRADVVLGLAGAYVGAGDPESAITLLQGQLQVNPLWIEGHAQLSRLRWMMGRPDDFAASYESAIARAPEVEALWGSYILTLMHARLYADVARVIDRARRAGHRSPTLDRNEAILRSETGDLPGADARYARLPPATDVISAVHYVRHLLRTGRLEQASVAMEPWLTASGHADMWPYAATVWRLLEDPRHQWLEGDPSLVGVVDLTERLPPLDQLAERLRRLHRSRNQHLDQSVRGGTQTDGNLFANIDPMIQLVRAAVAEAVREHLGKLPPVDPRHPTLRHRRDRTPRFAGAWSVMLRGHGHHANHVHPAGWVSSALYVELPPHDPTGPSDAGWLTLGEPQAELGIDIEPMRKIPPRPGQLVLFPSTMWHGTRPFRDGERLTIAFDVAHPTA